MYRQFTLKWVLIILENHAPVGLLFLVFGNIRKLGNYSEGRRGRHCMVVEFTTTY
jgi:hypothetical protein